MVSLCITFSEGLRIVIHELASCSAGKKCATNDFTPLKGASQLGIFVLLISRIKL